MLPIPSGTAHRAAVRRSKYVEARADVGAALLTQRSTEPVTVLGWLRGNNRLLVPAHGGAVEARPYLLVSDRHAAIVALSRNGERVYTELDPGAVALVADGAQLTLRSGNALLFVVSGAARERAGELVGLLRLSPIERLLEAARLQRLSGSRSGLALSSDLLARAKDRGSVRAQWLELMLTPAALERTRMERALASERVPPEALAELWQSWQLPRARAHALVEALLRSGEQALPWALALHERAREPAAVSTEHARAELALARAHAARSLTVPSADERPGAVVALLTPGGLAAGQAGTPTAPSAPLSDELVRARLVHPASRANGFDFWRAPALFARVGKRPAPDDLGDYCEPLLPSAHAGAARAVAAACRALGLPPLPAYVSRGKKSLGLCSQSGTPASLLIGVEHLTSGSAYEMNERELWFAIGSECAHLRLGHGRVTRRELWSGALAHTRDGLSLALGILPLLRGARLGVRLGRALERVPEPALRRLLLLLSGAEPARSLPAPGPRGRALSHFNEELVAAHRLTQLSADRAGLLLAGDLRASLRALLLVRPDYRALLAELESSAFAEDLLARAESPMLADLIVRSTALLSFYLSDDYAALRSALRGA